MVRLIHRLHSFLFPSLILTVVVVTGLQAQQDDSPYDTYHDSELNREDRKEFKEQREAWLRDMHRADPGVNVTVLSEEVRAAKRALRREKGASVQEAGESFQIMPSLRGSWNERGSRNQAGRTRSADIDFESNSIYVSADGGQIWKGTLEGKNWKPLNDDQRFPNVRGLDVIRSGDRLRVVVTYSNTIQYTDNDGATWFPSEGLNDIRSSGGFRRSITTDGPQPVIYAVGNEWDYEERRSFGVLYRSTDEGTTFSKVRRFESDRTTDIWSPPGTNFAYVLHDDTLSKVLPNGPMEVVSTPLVTDVGESITGTQVYLRGQNEETIYILTQRSGTRVYATPDKGENWIETGTTTSLFDPNSFDASPSYSGMIVVGGVETMYSIDAGFTWDTVNKWPAYYGSPHNRLHADVPFIKFLTKPNGTEMVIVSTDGGVYISEDSLKTVRNLSLSGLTNSQYYSVYTSRVDTNYVFAGAQDQGFQRATIDHGGVLEFDQTISGDYGHISSGDSGKTLWTDYPGFAMYYRDAREESMGRGVSLDFPTTGHLWIPPLVTDPDTPTVAYMAGGRVTSGTRLIRYKYYTTGDMTADELEYDFSRPGANGAISGFGISPVDTDVWYVITSSNTFFTSRDRGSSWTLSEEFDAPDGHYFYGVSVLPSKSRPGTVYLAGAGYSNPGVWVSHDYGVTFTEMSDGLPPMLIYDIDASSDDRFIFAATTVGPYMYIADSARWFDVSAGGAPDQNYWSVDYIEQNKVARFGTYGRGIWDLRLEPLSTGVFDAPGAITAADGLRLSAENRFSGTSTFSLDVPRTGTISVRIYDLSGKLVARLHDGTLNAGGHRFEWNGTTTGGAQLPAGPYFCVASGLGTAAYATVNLVR